MVFLFGGALRAGKGILGRQLFEEATLPLLSLDILKMGLYHAVPSLAVDPSAPSDEVGERMWPLVRAMPENAPESGFDCVFEGDVILPHHAADLGSIHSDGVRTCFLGYPNADPRQKLREIRRFSGHPNDWLGDHRDDEVLGFLRYGVEFSRYLARECDDLGLKFFDCSADFESTIDAARAYLLANLRSEA